MSGLKVFCLFTFLPCFTFWQDHALASSSNKTKSNDKTICLKKKKKKRQRNTCKETSSHPVSNADRFLMERGRHMLFCDWTDQKFPKMRLEAGSSYIVAKKKKKNHSKDINLAMEYLGSQVSFKDNKVGREPQSCRSLRTGKASPGSEVWFAPSGMSCSSLQSFSSKNENGYSLSASTSKQYIH